MRYKTGRIGPRLIDPKTIDFAVDTALNWEGDFPIVAKGDYLVTIGHINGDPETVLVSRRYIPASSTDEAAKIALDAFAERHNCEPYANGTIKGITTPDLSFGNPCWVERVDMVTK